METEHHHHEHDKKHCNGKGHEHGSCSCHNHCHEEHHHGEHGAMGSVIRIIITAIMLAAAVAIEHFYKLETWKLLLIYLIPYLTVGFGTLREAAENICEGEWFDENFLMAIATLGALSIGFLPGAEHQFPEAVFVMLFFQIGEMLEGIAEGRSRKSISQLMDIRPDIAHVVRDGKELTVNPEDVGIGETIVIKPGERVPMDAIVTQGDSSLDTSALTGESVPRAAHVGENIISGCINVSGVLYARVTKVFGESTAAKVLELVENADENKSNRENFITRFAKVYTPIVVCTAIAVAFLPPLIMEGEFLSLLPTWLYRALTFLVVSCPCALVISVPLSFFGGIGGASRQGILIKGSNYLEALAKTGIAVFDKTGTLTEGVFSVQVVHPNDISETELLHMAAHVERHSTHPIAISLREAYPNEGEDNCHIEAVEEIAGHGIKAMVNGKTVCVGNQRMMEAMGCPLTEMECGHKHVGTIIHVAIDGQYAGHIVISDRIKEDAHKAIEELKKSGVQRTVMLTGDHRGVAEHVAMELGLDECHAELLPGDKVEQVETLIGKVPKGQTLAFVGDGINDAPVLARADVGIAMGAMGSDAAIEAADVVLMDDNTAKLALGIKIAKKTLRIANENVYFSIGVKVLVLILAAFGIANMWMAVFADVGVTFLAVLNAMRTLKSNTL